MKLSNLYKIGEKSELSHIQYWHCIHPWTWFSNEFGVASVRRLITTFLKRV